MIEEVGTLRIDSVWDFTEKKLEEYQSIDKNFIFRKDLYNVLYAINSQPTCICKLQFIDQSNIIILDYSHGGGEIYNIGLMLKMVLRQILQKFPGINLYVQLDEPIDVLRKDKIISILEDMYYAVEFGRNPLFDSEQPIEIFLDNRIRTLWAFDGNMKNAYTMKTFIQKQQDKIEEVNAKRMKELNLQQERMQPLSTPPTSLPPRQPLLLSEVSPAPADEKESPRVKTKSRKEVAFESEKRKRNRNNDKKVVTYENNTKDKDFNAQPKPKSRGRPPKTN